jgi:hypothetical protein
MDAHDLPVIALDRSSDPIPAEVTDNNYSSTREEGTNFYICRQVNHFKADSFPIVLLQIDDTEELRTMERNRYKKRAESKSLNRL